MRKTFCDRCGAECINTTGHIGGHIEHSTRAGETVGVDELMSSDLCKTCTEATVKFLGLVLRPRELEKDGPGYSGIVAGPPHYIGSRELASPGWQDIGATDGTAG